MGSVLSFVPAIWQLRDTARGCIRIVRNTNAAKKMRADLTRYLRDVIMLLENCLCSLSAEDSERVRILIGKLTITLQELSKQSTTRSLREMYLSGTHRFDEIREEVGMTLNFIQLKSAVDLQGITARLASITEGGTHYRDRSLDVVATSDDPAPNLQQTGCKCGLQNLVVDNHLSPQSPPIHQGQASPGVTEGEGFSDTLVAAFKNVEHHRLLVQATGDHKMCLANSLNLLAHLLRQSGRMKEAVACNQEALELHLAVNHSY
ncbi:hypothetical protein RSAG8_09773, partial [Rhizoctonia solani AG-8 WAC10335]